MSPAIKRYRKKPIVIQGMQWDGTAELGLDISNWASEYDVEISYHPHLLDGKYVAHPDPFLKIKTLEGTMIASTNDWIIKGVNNEFYPCKPDIFEKTYEVVEDE